MANPLALLLGQQLSTAVDPEEILVTAPQPRPTAAKPRFGDAPPREDIDPRYVLNDDRIAPLPEEVEEILPRRGMFGIKGTLRDVLGILGDAFLTQAGRDTVYAPRRQMEREADALFGFTQDPLQAIERLATQNPQQAQELFDALQTQQLRQAQLQSQEAARKSLIEDRAFDNRETGLNRVSRWVAGGLPYDRVLAGARNYGLGEEDLAELGVYPDMTPEERQQFASGDMTVNQQVQVPFTERRVATGEKNAETARISATRPRNPPPRPRADTDTETYFSIANIPENQRTPEQKAFMKKYIQGTRGGRTAPPPPPAAGGSASRFRIIN